MSDAEVWVGDVIHGLPRPLVGVTALLLDPHEVVPADALKPWDRYVAFTPWEIRRQYERHLRDRTQHSLAALLHIINPAIQRPDQLPLGHLAIADGRRRSGHTRAAAGRVALSC